MSSTASHLFVTEEEYLAFDRAAPYKHEFIHGEIIAMTGASPKHNRLCFNLQGALSVALKANPCEGYASDMRVRGSGSYVYPDVSIVCGKEEVTDEDILENPTAAFEILSPSTEKRDRGSKFLIYQTLPSLREYILISQHEVKVEHYVKSNDGPWLLRAILSTGEMLRLLSCNAELSIDTIYDKVFSKDDINLP